MTKYDDFLQDWAGKPLGIEFLKTYRHYHRKSRPHDHRRAAPPHHQNRPPDNPRPPHHNTTAPVLPASLTDLQIQGVPCPG